MNKKIRFSPTLCLTHNCNLNCIYCFQKHDTAKMTLETAKICIDWIFDNIPNNTEDVEIGFIGGEPLLEFTLLKDIVEYTYSKKTMKHYSFFATTNGTLLNDDMKMWFSAHKDKIVLGLSLDGTKETHDYNRNNSFDKIDINFFLKTWTNQGVKMTLSEYSLPRLAENIKFIHSLGFKDIYGVNLFEGTFDWSLEQYIEILISQLKELVKFYVENDSFPLNHMLSKHLNICEALTKEKESWCGFGKTTLLFDVDGRKLPCTFCTSMTFTESELKDIEAIDFTNNENFIDVDCFSNCYIYPICPTCAGANYLNNKTFQYRDKRRCRVQKLIALFIADLQAKRIAKNPAIYDNDKLYYTIEAIKKIREFYLPEFKDYFKE